MNKLQCVTNLIILQITLLTLAFVIPAIAVDLSCKVVGVADGDTLTILCPSNKRVKIRLGEIDAPEKKQAFGERSRQSLANMCFGKMARIVQQDRDDYGRTVARVRCGNIDVNAEQVSRGMAWVYGRYAKDRNLYRLQDEARAVRRGLWADKAPISPWEWRKKRNN